MEKTLRDGLLEAIEKCSIYDWLATNYWRCSKDELADIAKELAFALEDIRNGNSIPLALDSLLSEVEDRIGEDE